MNYSEGSLLLHLISSVCVSCLDFTNFSAFSCPIQVHQVGQWKSTCGQMLGKYKLPVFPSWSPILRSSHPSRGRVAMNPAAHSKHLALSNPTSVARDLPWLHLAFAEDSQRYLKVKGSWKTFFMWQQKITSPLIIFVTKNRLWICDSMKLLFNRYHSLSGCLMSFFFWQTAPVCLKPPLLPHFWGNEAQLTSDLTHVEKPWNLICHKKTYPNSGNSFQNLDFWACQWKNNRSRRKKVCFKLTASVFYSWCKKTNCYMSEHALKCD